MVLARVENIEEWEDGEIEEAEERVDSSHPDSLF
jgi:hypothetical protein